MKPDSLCELNVKLIKGLVGYGCVIMSLWIYSGSNQLTQNYDRFISYQHQMSGTELFRYCNQDSLRIPMFIVFKNSHVYFFLEFPCLLLIEHDD